MTPHGKHPSTAWIGRALMLSAIVAAVALTAIMSGWLSPTSAHGPPPAGSRAPNSADMPPPPVSRAPFAAGDNSGNIPLNRARRRVLNRWIARRTGRIRALHLRVRTAGASACADDPGTGYGRGNSGLWRSTTHPVRANGTPNRSVTYASSVFRPCDVKDGNSVRVRLGFRAIKGRLYATVVSNVDRRPKANFFSQNFLYAASGLVGANARNELDSDAADTFYGLDPREAVGYSRDGGAHWRIPGGPYGPSGGRAFIPTFLQEYANGYVAGQPLYSATRFDGLMTMVYRQRKAATITHIGAYTSGAGEATAILAVDGRDERSAVLRGKGHIRSPIEPLAVKAGQTITVATLAGDGGLDLREQYAGAVWARYAALSSRRARYLQRDPARLAPIYPMFATASTGR